ncbi:glutaredoxin family protein [Brevibacterium sp. H602]|jgi:glutaredoxin|uniref:glutaredoxin family protein n=1 Tax=unclassified Brevibacterium TaxID=2614124 RepID=UPI003978A5DE
MVDLTFLTRVDCHLCADALQAVTEVAAGRDVAVTEIDIDTDDDLAAQYGWDVPVVLLNGRQHSFHRVDRDRLSKALDALGA